MRDSTYSIETAGRITVALHLDSSIHAIGDIHAEHVTAKLDMRQTERAQAVDLEGMHEGDVIVVAGIAAEGEQDLNGRLAVAHFQSEREGA